jgi:hypothetical protein
MAGPYSHRCNERDSILLRVVCNPGQSKQCLREDTLLGVISAATHSLFRSAREAFVIQRPHGVGVFEFAVIASLRTSQLRRGCAPRVDGNHGVAVTAQLEVACGRVSRVSVPQPSHSAGVDDASLAITGL